MSTGDYQNVSAIEIENGINYMETNFMNKLETIGQDLIDNYRSANASLKSEAIDQIIAEQVATLDAIRTEFDAILQIARGNMGESLETIQSCQATINSSLEQAIGR